MIALPLIRPIRAEDVPRIGRIVEAAGTFNPVEIETAIELAEDALRLGDSSEYLVNVLEDGRGEVRGFECHGPTALTDRTFDLYWIAVDPGSQGRGFGQQLLRFVEEDVRQRRGRLVVIETSAQESYRPTIRFYQRAGYDLACRIKDFYRDGDDKLVFTKDVRVMQSATRRDQTA